MKCDQAVRASIPIAPAHSTTDKKINQEIILFHDSDLRIVLI